MTNNWISVKDRLPEEEVIAFSKDHEMLIGYVYESGNEKGFYIAENEGEKIYPVTHWQPLPEPPQEVE